jgi:drug/metabolite transporter (DMT)-like permease
VASGQRLKALGALAWCALLWSTGGLGIKLVSWNPMAIAGTRSLIAGLVILAYLYIRRGGPRIREWPLQLAGGAAYAGTMISYVAAVKLTTAANAILLQYTSPVFTAILGWLILRERVSWVDWVSVAAVMVGMVVFFVGKLTFAGTWGNILAIASGILFSLTFVLVRKQREGSAVESLAAGHFMAFLVSIPFLRGGGPGAMGWVGLAYLGVFQVGLTSLLMSYGLKHVPALQSMLVSLIEPILTPVWVLLVVGEVPSPAAVAGGAIIIGVVVARSALSLRRPRAAIGR